MDKPVKKMETPQAAKYIGAEPQTLNKWRSRGRGPAYYKYAGKVLYRLEDLDAFIEASRVDPAATEPKRRKRRVGGAK